MKKIYLLAASFLLNLSAFAQQENALHFDNIDDYASAANASALVAGSTEMTLTFWVYPENAAPVYPDYDGYAGFRNNSDADFYVLQLFNANTLEARFRNSLGQNYDIAYTGMTLNNWQHFALVYDGSVLSLFHNGLIVGSVAASGTIASNSESLYIGMLPWTATNFYTNGKIDEVTLWDKALSTQEILCMLNNGVDPLSANLQLYYRFNQGVAGGSNGTVNTLSDATGSINATLSGFTLAGTTSNWTSGVLLPGALLLTDTLCPGTTYTFGSQTITTPGTYYAAFPGMASCDSIVQLVLVSPVINTSVLQVGPMMTAQQAGAVYQWIDCLNGNAPVPGATTQTYTATSNGQYAVVISLGGCADTSNCITVVNVGLPPAGQEASFQAASPFSNQLDLKINRQLFGEDLTVSDISGKTVWNSTVRRESLTIPSGDWPAGLYLVRVTGTSGSLRLLKQ